MEYNPSNPFREQPKIQAFEKYFNVESEFMAAKGYSHKDNIASLRRLAFSMIQEYSKVDEFDALVPFLAMNYFDRFLSRTTTDDQLIPVMDEEVEMHENVMLFLICSLTIAWKMRNKAFSLTDFLGKHKMDIEPKKITEMELEILNGLQWRMRSITPICFLEYFFPFFKLSDPKSNQGFTLRHILRTIVATQADIKFTEFRPSSIAASALLQASSKLFPAQFPQLKKEVFSCAYVDKEDLLRCMDAMGIKYKGKEKLNEDPDPEPEPKTGEALSLGAGGSGEGSSSEVRATEPNVGETTSPTNEEDIGLMNIEPKRPTFETKQEPTIHESLYREALAYDWHSLCFVGPASDVPSPIDPNPPYHCRCCFM